MEVTFAGIAKTSSSIWRSSGSAASTWRTSFWARLKQAASADEAVQPEEQQEHEQEWTVTTSGLIAILLAWSSFKGKVKHGHDKTSAIIGLLTGLVRFFLPMGPGLALQVGTLDEPLGSIEVANRRLDLTELGRHGGAEGLKKKLASAGEACICWRFGGRVACAWWSFTCPIEVAIAGIAGSCPCANHHQRIVRPSRVGCRR